MKIKFKLRNWYDPEYWQFAILPHFMIWYGGNLCIAFGWMFWCQEIWIGNDLEELI